MGTLYNAETYAPTVPNIFPVLYPCYPPSPLLRRLFDPVQRRRQLANPICEPPDEVVDKSWRRPRQKALDHVSSLFDILPNLSDLHANHLNVPDPAPLERPDFECACLDSGIGRARGLQTFTIRDYSVCVPGDTWLRGLVAAAGASRLHTLNLRSLRAKDFRDLSVLLAHVGSSLKHLTINSSRFAREELGAYRASASLRPHHEPLAEAGWFLPKSGLALCTQLESFQLRCVLRRGRSRMTPPSWAFLWPILAQTPHQTLRRLQINVSAAEEDYTPGVNFVWQDLDNILSEYPALEQVSVVFEDALEPGETGPELANLVKSNMVRLENKLHVLVCVGNQCW